jgi:histidyl-tRNA synthetase
MKTLPGFRDLYPDEQAVRRALFTRWSDVARAHAFAEVDTPTLEPLELYQKKSGDELVGQLFGFEDRGGREVALRPELTPSVARMVVAKNREMKKPIRWFSVGSFFRFERPQRGRTREFAQFNCDLFGSGGPAADAEVIALLIALLRSTGLTSEHFAVRISDRAVWADFLVRNQRPESDLPALLQIIDKLGREADDKTEERLKGLSLSLDQVRGFINEPAADHPAFAALAANFTARGLGDFVLFDRSIVRGLAYYTGVVFEAFDRRGELRAIAGGGRYDGLLAKISDGSCDLPALGFAIGDVVITDMLQSLPEASSGLMQSARALLTTEIYLVVAEENLRAEALQIAGKLRETGWRVDYALQPEKVGKQFQAAEISGAKYAVVFGNEWPLLKLKDLASRTETSVESARLPQELHALLSR